MQCILTVVTCVPVYCYIVRLAARVHSYVDVTLVCRWYLGTTAVALVLDPYRYCPAAVDPSVSNTNDSYDWYTSYLVPGI